MRLKRLGVGSGSEGRITSKSQNEGVPGTIFNPSRPGSIDSGGPYSPVPGTDDRQGEFRPNAEGVATVALQTPRQMRGIGNGLSSRVCAEQRKGERRR